MHQWEKEVSRWGKLGGRDIIVSKYWGSRTQKQAAFRAAESGRSYGSERWTSGAVEWFFVLFFLFFKVCYFYFLSFVSIVCLSYFS
jgi:hypothetical protein